MTACTFGQGCNKPAIYLITFDDHYVGGSFPACADCTAEARANDPLEYIESVTSLPRSPDA